jgi:hypothetical protein
VSRNARCTLPAEQTYRPQVSRGEYGELLIMPADDRWDLTWRLKGLINIIQRNKHTVSNTGLK